MPLGKRLVQNTGSKVIEPRKASSALTVSADISDSRVSFCDAPLISASHFARPIRVACVGDSITYGYGLTNRRRNCYPARLGDLLGNNWCVHNFGVNGAMLLKNGTRPYCKERVYQSALGFKPDVVIIMLGTNDTKRDSWEAHQTEFASDYRDLIRSFRGLPTKPRLYLCVPPPLFRDRGKLWDTDQVLRDKILPKINAVAVRSKLRVVDFYSTFAGKPERFSDGVHPNAKGAEKLAAIIHVVLTGRKAASAGVTERIKTGHSEARDSYHFRFFSQRIFAARSNEQNRIASPSARRFCGRRFVGLPKLRPLRAFS